MVIRHLHLEDTANIIHRLAKAYDDPDLFMETANIVSGYPDKQLNNLEVTLRDLLDMITAEQTYRSTLGSAERDNGLQPAYERNSA